MTDRVYLVTPPQRDAIRELAIAYAEWHHASGPFAKIQQAARRLLAAQDTFAIELVKREALLSYLGYQEAA